MLINEPYKHEIGVGAFPEGMYAEMVKNLPDNSEYRRYDAYPKRFLYKIDNGFWREVFDFIVGPWRGWNVKTQLLRDFPGYEIGPHTDTVKKLKTFLYYITDKEVKGAGTGIFKPKLEGFTSRTGAHYDFDAFEHVGEAPYVPNGFFSFDRTDNSFHGVRPSKVVRNVMQVSIYRRDQY